MKGILGRKIGMTSMFLSTGKQIPVTMIEIGENIVTQTISNKEQGYTALQLAAFNKKKKQVSKPESGHFKKSKTTPKRFVKEIRNMEGIEIGRKVPISIFKTGEFVDVTATSKGKGFAGTIKRWNQTIGPKSHGGGGGSQPLRQTGSLGTMAQKRVLKGMTMPGHLGAEQKTIQNLEIIQIDEKNNLLIVKGSIPGPKKGFVVIKENIKQIQPKASVELVDLNIMHAKNELLDEAKKYGALINTDMTIEAMEDAVNKAKIAKLAHEKVEEIQSNIKLHQTNINDMTIKFDDLNTRYEILIKENANSDDAKLVKDQIDQITNQIKTTKTELKDLEEKLVEATADFDAKNKESKAAQIEVEEEEKVDDSEKKEVK